MLGGCLKTQHSLRQSVPSSPVQPSPANCRHCYVGYQVTDIFLCAAGEGKANSAYCSRHPPASLHRTNDVACFRRCSCGKRPSGSADGHHVRWCQSDHWGLHDAEADRYVHLYVSHCFPAEVLSCCTVVSSLQPMRRQPCTGSAHRACGWCCCS